MGVALPCRQTPLAGNHYETGTIFIKLIGKLSSGMTVILTKQQNMTKCSRLKRCRDIPMGPRSQLCAWKNKYACKQD